MIERILYNYFALPLGLAGFRLWALFDQKARTGISRRQNLLAELALKISALGPGRRILVHVSSVGEYLQARPVLRLLRQNPELKIILSFYSPSLEPMLANGVEAEFATYLPFDRKTDMEKFLEALKPALIIFSCYDLWPNLLWCARKRRIKTALINASLAENSGKLNPLARWWFAKLYRGLDLLLAASEEDRRAIAGFGVRGEKLFFTGNARFDETMARIRAIPENDPLLSALRSWLGGPPEPCLLVGSSWPEDEAVLFPVLERIWASGRKLKLVIAPHEPSEAHVQELVQKFSLLKAAPVLLSAIESKGAGAAVSCKVIIVDSIGKLYKLYQLADMALVGGSFRKEVHNVMEPAGFGLPVIFGPKIKNSLEALKLVERKAGFVVHDAEELYSRLEGFLSDKEQRLAAGRKARELVAENQGAGERTWRMLSRHFPEVFSGREGN
jgi:3-deoxy-D-manno-octulosonic-acid transferase